MTATTTCTDAFNCVTVYPPTLLGDIHFLLGFLIFLQALIFCGFFFNTFQKNAR